MNSALEIAKEIVRNHNSIKGDGDYKIALGSIGSGGERFCATASGDLLTIDAESSAAAAAAAAQLVVGMKSGHLAEFMGEQQPRFALRPLWLGSDTSFIVHGDAGISLPGFLVEKDQKTFHLFCRRLYELGFNAVILGSKGGMFENKKPDLYFDELQLLCKRFHDYGLSVFLKYDFFLPENLPATPLHEPFREWLKDHIKGLPLTASDGVFWGSAFLEKNFHHHRSAISATQQDLALAEAQLLESLIPPETSLLYYLPVMGEAMAKKQAPWLLEFIDDLSHRTLFLFSTVQGPADHDHLPPHPLWALLRQRPDVSAAALLPLMNFGGVSIGEGLWPNLPFDLWENYLSQCSRHHFAGVAGLTHRIPCEGSLLDGALWIAGQSLWRDHAPTLLADTWCHAYRKEVAASFEFVQLMRKAREILLGLSAILADEVGCFHAAECEQRVGDLQAQLACLLAYSKKVAVASPQEGASITDYVELFVKEAKRVLARFKELYRLPGKELIGQDDEAPGFWTEFDRDQGGRLPVLKMRKTAYPGAAGTVWEKIYRESCLDGASSL